MRACERWMKNELTMRRTIAYGKGTASSGILTPVAERTSDRRMDQRRFRALLLDGLDRG